MVKEKDSLFTELKESRYDVASLRDQLEREKKIYDEKQLDSQRDIRKLAQKLKGKIKLKAEM